MSRFINLIFFYVIFIFRIDLAEPIKRYKDVRHFPKEFAFGVATASYQIEGSWNISGKGLSIWDYLTHSNPDVIYDKTNGDIACDSYNQYKRDVDMLVELGVDYYRFSLSWTRILPTGYAVPINQEGVDYYNRLIDALIEKNIIPFVTIYHWDLPQNLQQLGGWTNPLMEIYYEDYANLVFELFGDRVKHWQTFNEPKQVCLEGYGDALAAPALNFSGIADYACGHTLLNSHARVFRLYNQKYRIRQGGSIGITIEATWGEPFSQSEEDLIAADAHFQFDHGWFMHPIFSPNGDYPQVMKDRVAAKSRKQGFSISRLPEFTKEQISSLRGSADFLGLNFYSTEMVKHKPESNNKVPSFYDDVGVISYVNNSWPGSASDWLKVTPWAFKKMLNRIRVDYNNPEVLITENGYSTRGGLVDNDRIKFINYHLNALLDSMEQGSNVKAYTIWSLMDNFEWMRGYSERFGLYEVNFDDPLRKRLPRDSAKYFRSIIKSRSVNRHDPEYYNLLGDSGHVYI